MKVNRWEYVKLLEINRKIRIMQIYWQVGNKYRILILLNLCIFVFLSFIIKHHILSFKNLSIL